ncbi:PREDICTED: MRG/MORF4L-binding protein-like isoform X2 [Amphimedon queenslandica]|uniref:Uncharacterized protein n=1 Tax=Amphimedon queenslandica TaxID=400682 RepID=A0AAN0IX12_AMPQE|nr:PREDICTED: MRG/MORF4L-binding protein-like isoform X2 [Amphimedon queenslandica]|eukprot:XP_019848986.1 PREDICTED: MRG/MORF4L-binding protein-like isoform X2 [Amphimedon queenslandica]
MEEGEEDIKWTPEMEVALFKAMLDHKPVGVNKHWHMLCIHHRMITQGGVVIPTRLIWKHLQSLYDLAALDETEAHPVICEEFYLPSYFYQQEGVGDGDQSSSRKRHRVSSSPSPAASPLSVTKRKRAQ